MNADEFSEIIQDIANEDTKGVIVLILKKADKEFLMKEFGDVSYFEALGLLSTAHHDYLQDPYDFDHIATCHPDLMVGME